MHRLSLAAALLLAAAAPARAQTPSTAHAREHAVTQHASGTFDVNLAPQPTDAPGISRMSLDKQFHGDLEATSKGEMLANGSASGSGVYVAMEVVTGTLHGRSGSFALHHTGIMTRGTPQLTIAVVPDSGTGDLVGLNGTMGITIADGKHSYEFEYTIPDR